MSPEMADASLKDLHNYDGYFWVSPWNLGDNLFAYAREATIEGDTLTIRYSLYEAQPGDEGFLAAAHGGLYPDPRELRPVCHHHTAGGGWRLEIHQSGL